LIVAGKAHPRDEEGKHLIQEWARFAARPEARPHVVFLDDYDMSLAKELVQGVDAWINTPRRPWEASGTSGMKVLVNGGLNVSTLDGWWAEAFEPDRGWALGNHTGSDDDGQEAEQLYSLLEDEVVPAFYERDAKGHPRRWMARMRASMATLTPQFSSVRMLQEYVERAYVPGAAACKRRSARESGIGRELDAWSTHLAQHWDGIRFGAVTETVIDQSLTASVPVDLGEIDPASVRVELFADAEGDGEPEVHEMAPAEPMAGDGTIYHATFETARPFADFTVRVVPYHPEARVPLELSLIAWQR
jgi:starch phosphorylase